MYLSLSYYLEYDFIIFCLQSKTFDSCCQIETRKTSTSALRHFGKNQTRTASPFIFEVMLKLKRQLSRDLCQTKQSTKVCYLVALPAFGLLIFKLYAQPHSFLSGHSPRFLSSGWKQSFACVLTDPTAEEPAFHQLDA